MGSLIYTLAVFGTALTVHVIWWKIRLPGNHSRALGLIFSGMVVAAGFVLALLKRMTGLEWARAMGPADYGQMSAAYAALCLAYLVTYSAVEVDSPSLVMVGEIARAGNVGYEESRFDQEMDNTRLVIPRIHDLVKGGLVVLKHGRYYATPKGKRIAALFSFYRRVLGREQKGG